ncbi:SOS response-associated peptidase family protein [Aquisalimonas sp.]|uniref:SOS response-associated peptidase family protein n=1 Tax=Aquisalimonas sp. TaxID=1872621 RepID=UPI0034552A06
MGISASLGRRGRTPPPITHIHSRMPLLLDPDPYRSWLNPNVTERDAIKQTTRPLAQGLLGIGPSVPV